MTVGFENLTRWVMTLLDEAADFGRRRVSPAVIDARRNLGSVVAGTLLLLIFIDFSLPFLVQWSIMMIEMVLLLTLLSGLLVQCLRGEG